MDCENVEVCLAIVWSSVCFFILLYSCFIFNIFQGIRYMIWYVHGPWPSCGAPTLRLRLRSGAGCLPLGRFKALQASAKINDLSRAMNETKPFRSVDMDIGGNKVYVPLLHCHIFRGFGGYHTSVLIAGEDSMALFVDTILTNFSFLQHWAGPAIVTRVEPIIKLKS